MDANPESIQTGQPRLESVLEPWKLRPGFRRDGEPHRAELLTGLAQFSTAAAWVYVSVFPFLFVLPGLVFSDKAARRDLLWIGSCLLCFLPPLIAIGSALFTRNLAAYDLNQIDAGKMDPRGRAESEATGTAARAALWISILGPCGWGILVLFFLILAISCLPHTFVGPG
jgi:hypothetical protein